MTSWTPNPGAEVPGSTIPEFKPRNNECDPWNPEKHNREWTRQEIDEAMD